MKFLAFYFIFLDPGNFYSFTDSIPKKNKQLVEYVELHGRSIAPTYEKVVCTEFLIGALKHFVPLTAEDKKRIRIISEAHINALRLIDSDVPKGVYFALKENKLGLPIDKLNDVLPGDLVQFWYTAWGHCGIVKSIDVEKREMELYSSFPTTKGFGVQKFQIPPECYFIRLK